MSTSAHDLQLLQQLHEKFAAIGQNTTTHLEGLLHAKPITYWDYIQTDALLNLQVQRTTQPDEMVFIMYHQINELLFKLMLWEIEQIAIHPALTTHFFAERLTRISRYFDMLSSSFDVMGNGMEIAQYMKFRTTLTPASGFQSAQYRMVEFSSTELENLIDARFRKSYTPDMPTAEAFELLYWQAAGKDHQTGEKSTLIRLFEERYKEEFFRFIERFKTVNLWTKYKSLPKAERSDANLVAAMRHYDYSVNITWVMAHYNAAGKYLDSGDKPAEATGGSDWRKYMHPRYQKRIFFPELWSAEEHTEWGITNLPAK